MQSAFNFFASPYGYYVAWFSLSTLALLITRTALGVSPSRPTSSSKDQPSPEFQRFQRKYLIVYLIMMGADWVQGPFVHELYEVHYKYDHATIGKIFIAGFATRYSVAWSLGFPGVGGLFFSSVILLFFNDFN